METKTLVTEWQARRIADWWLEQFSSPRFDNGDQSTSGGMATMMAVLLAGRSSAPTDEQAEKFRASIAAEIVGKPIYEARIGADYHPGRTLGDAMNDAKIPSSLCPWKSMSFANADGTVSVSLGYRSPGVVLAPSETEATR